MYLCFTFIFQDLSPSCPKFISTQAPLPVTLIDYWLMVYEQGVEVLVALSGDTETGKVWLMLKYIFWIKLSKLAKTSSSLYFQNGLHEILVHALSKVIQIEISPFINDMACILVVLFLGYSDISIMFQYFSKA